MTLLTANECAKMANVSKRTIQNKIKQGKLSATRDKSGYYQIDPSEFFRVYPGANNQEDSSNDSQENNETPNQETDLLKKEIGSLKRENELLRSQLNKSEAREKDLIETLKSNTRLLEHHNGNSRKRFLGIF